MDSFGNLRGRGGVRRAKKIRAKRCSMKIRKWSRRSEKIKSGHGGRRSRHLHEGALGPRQGSSFRGEV